MKKVIILCFLILFGSGVCYSVSMEDFSVFVKNTAQMRTVGIEYDTHCNIPVYSMDVYLGIETSSICYQYFYFSDLPFDSWYSSMFLSLQHKVRSQHIGALLGIVEWKNGRNFLNYPKTDQGIELQIYYGISAKHVSCRVGYEIHIKNSLYFNNIPINVIDRNINSLFVKICFKLK